MIKHISIILVAVIVLSGLSAYSVLERVPYNEIHLIQRFGQTMRILDGRSDSGLHFKWPWPIESSVVYDARIFTFEGATTQITTSDQKTLLITLSCSWQIDAKDPKQFYKSVRDIRIATERIRAQLSDAKEVFGHYKLDEFVNLSTDKIKLADMEDAIFNRVSPQCLASYGVNIRMIRIKLQSLPKSVTQEVFESVKGSQEEEVNRYKGEGEAIAMAIEHRAKQAQQQILAMAKRKAGEIRSKGELAATKSYETMSADPWLAQYLRELEALEAVLASRTTLFLDWTDMRGIKYLFQGPPAQEIPAESKIGGSK